jgi:hypothetical protein
MSRPSNNTEFFHEVQRLPLRRAAIALAVPPCAMAAILVWQVLLGHSWGKYSVSNANIVGWTVFLWIVYFRLITVRMVTDVQNRELIVALRGLWRKRRVPADDIADVEVITFDAERDYGGYGIRSIRGATAYIAKSGEGVRVRLRTGSALVIGSQRSGSLAEVLRQVSRMRIGN